MLLSMEGVMPQEQWVCRSILENLTNPFEIGLFLQNPEGNLHLILLKFQFLLVKSKMKNWVLQVGLVGTVICIQQGMVQELQL